MDNPRWRERVKYLAVILEGANDMQTAAGDSEHSKHDAERQKCLKGFMLAYLKRHRMSDCVPPMELAC